MSSVLKPPNHQRLGDEASPHEVQGNGVGVVWEKRNELAFLSRHPPT